jgi:23S rRNA (cytidine1920-2'-O)/16S rRNA (cytidine1409-2'-O)-methyltransferase
LNLPRRRIDILLVERGLFESRAKAQAAIAAGLVLADGKVVDKASNEVAVDAALRAQPAFEYVSRGGVKLAAALDRFDIDAAGRVCLDVGASTGGFTDVLLRRGAKHVYAVDVGHGQLHDDLRAAPRVTSLEKQDIRKLDVGALPEAPDLAVADVSFISLKAVLPAISGLIAPRATFIGLIKPQFESGPGEAKKGIVKSPAAHQRACDEVVAALRALGWRIIGVMPSPLAGGDGNVEFLVGAQRG